MAVHQLCLYSVLVTATGHFMAFSFVAARRKAAEGKRKIKTDEEEMAGMFFSPGSAEATKDWVCPLVHEAKFLWPKFDLY